MNRIALDRLDFFLRARRIAALSGAIRRRRRRLSARLARDPSTRASATRRGSRAAT